MEGYEKLKCILVPFYVVLIVLRFCLGLFSLMIVVMLLILLNFIYLPWKCFVLLVMKCSAKNAMYFMEPMDTLYMAYTDADRKYIVLITVFEASADIKWITTMLQNQLFSHEKENPKLVHKMLLVPYCAFGYWFWEDKSKEFNINLHVRKLDGIEDNTIITECQLLNAVEKISYEPFPIDKPMWEILHVPKFQYDKDVCILEHQNLCAYVIRCHHSYGDAMTILKNFVFKNLDPPLYSNMSQPTTSVIKKLSLFVREIYVLGKLLLQSFRSEEQTAIYGPKLNGDKLLCASQIIKFDMIQQIRTIQRVSIYSIFITTVTEAMKKYFKEKQLKIPETMGVAFNLSAKIPDPQYIGISNNALALIVPVQIKEKSQVERLHKINTDVNNTISFLHFCATFLLPVITWLLKDLPFYINNVICHLPLAASLMVVNLPVPVENRTLNGKKINGLILFSPHHGLLGVNACFINFGGKVRLALLVDKGLIKHKEDVHLIVNYWEDSLKELISEKSKNNILQL